MSWVMTCFENQNVPDFSPAPQTPHPHIMALRPRQIKFPINEIHVMRA